MRIPLIMAILIVGLAILTDVYISFDLRYNYPRRRYISRIYDIIGLLCMAFLATCLVKPRREAGSDILFQMWGIFAYLTILIPKLIFCIFSLAGLLPGLRHSKSLKLGKWVGLPLGVLTFILMWWGALVTRNEIEVTQVEISSDRLPEGFDGFRIAQISDLHVGTWGEDTRFIERLVDSVNMQHPDIILFTGDLVNRQTGELAPFMKPLSRLKAPLGVYSVLGNHDYGDYIDWASEADKRDNLSLLRNWQRQIGWKLLDNQRTNLVWNGDTIQLIGVENWGEPPFRQYGHLLDAYPLSRDSVYNLNDDRFKILMTHNPEHWRREVTKISNIDLTLSGHTHAMQTEVKIGSWKWSPAVFRYPTWGGIYSEENPRGDRMQLYVNIGAGEVGMPYRIGAVPEITLITLRR